MRAWTLTALVLALLVAGLAAAALLAWPAGALAGSSTGLAEISLPSFAGRLESVGVDDQSGRPVGIVLRDGTIVPKERVAPGERLTVTVRISRPSWIGWLVGRSVERTLTVVAPVARVSLGFLRPARGAAIRVHFSSPVSRVAIAGRRVQWYAGGRSVVPIGVRAAGRASAGSTTVAAAVRPWEKLSPAFRVSWFVAGGRTRIVSDPAAGGRLMPRKALTLTFAQPVTKILGSRLPTLEPATQGHWEQVDAHTLVFRPAGLGFGLGGTVHLRVPGRTLAWHVAAGSTLRLQEILARLGYLPVRWHPAAGPSQTLAVELAGALSAPEGRFTWRYAQTPVKLRELWKPGSWNVVTEGAVMRFQDVHNFATDGIPGPQVWRALLHDDLAGRRLGSGYSYVLVHETIPQSLGLWHNGRMILTSPGNTGIPQAPTAPGTWPVFEHISVGTMSGTNPDGSHYSDPGVRWISYFHGGDALHSFPRPSYGTPQSLGCVELPDAAAARLWPYTPIGTLVTIEP